MADETQTIGRYRILERVGRGGMGVLYRGVDPVLDREVAIKVMSADVTGDDDDARNRFFREARAAAKLQHRNIVTIFEFAEEGGTPYIVMEFLRGRSLSSRMTSSPPLTTDQTLDIVSQLCVGLQFAHENGVVHRDVKPGNIWLLEDGTVKLLDFGIAKFASSAFTKKGDVLGSAPYMAPEQLSGGAIDGRVDIFASAVVLYELLAGRKPFEGDSPTSTILKIVQDPAPALDAAVTGLPPALGAAVARGLEKDPAKRYQSAGSFGAELQMIRLSLHTTGDTIFGDEFRFEEDTLSRPQVRKIDDAPVAAEPGQPAREKVDPDLRGPDDTAPFEYPPVPPPAPSKSRAVPIAIAALTIVLLAGAGWFAWMRANHVIPEPVSAAASSTSVPSPPPASPVVTPAAADGEPATRPAVAPATSVVPDPTPAPAVVTPPAPRAQPITLQASGSYPFEIVDGRRVVSAAATSHDISVASPRVLRLRAAGYFLDQAVNIDGPGRTVQVTAPELGRLTIRSTMETCQVSVNGQDLGFPPINSRLIAAGTYNVQLKCPDGRIVRGAPVTVAAGQTLIAKVP